jgi:hypothetical protein
MWWSCARVPLVHTQKRTHTSGESRLRQLQAVINAGVEQPGHTRFSKLAVSLYVFAPLFISLACWHGYLGFPVEVAERRNNNVSTSLRGSLRRRWGRGEKRWHGKSIDKSLTNMHACVLLCLFPDKVNPKLIDT